MSDESYILPGLNVNPAMISAAGYSSGAFNSHQLHMVMSGTIKGSGLIDGSWYSSNNEQFSSYEGKTE